MYLIVRPFINSFQTGMTEFVSERWLLTDVNRYIFVSCMKSSFIYLYLVYKICHVWKIVE